ncbi:MAG TPA: VOC family protein [Candidatus Binatia bacterium]
MPLAKKIDHVAIVVKDLDAAVKTFTANFAFPVERSGVTPQLNMRWAFLSIGDAALELFQPTSAANPGMQFLSERGEGMYAVSLEVESLADAVAHLAKKGITARIQSLHEGTKVCFISPKHTHGVLLQLIEHPK